MYTVTPINKSFTVTRLYEDCCDELLRCIGSRHHNVYTCFSQKFSQWYFNV